MEMTAKDEKTKAKERDSNTHKLSLSIKHTHTNYAQRHVLAHNCMCSKGERQIVLRDYSVSHCTTVSSSVH